MWFHFPGFAVFFNFSLTRGVGIFGEVLVTWQISPPDRSTFMDISGSITFVEGQQNATIIIEVKLVDSASHDVVFGSYLFIKRKLKLLCFVEYLR